MASSTTALNLEQLRRRKGVSLDDIAGSTKIGTYFLTAIEAEQFDKLPGGLFSRSYIRQYAAALDIPHEDILERFAAFEAETQEVDTRNTVRERRFYGLGSVISLIASILVVSPRNS